MTEKKDKEGGGYLVVADETEEFPVALRYAARMAQANGGHVSVLYSIKIEDFQHWGNIEDRMREEMREKAEKLVWEAAKNINDLNGMVPALYMEEGDRFDVLIDVINKNPEIEMLVLAGTTSSSTGASGPGPLVSHFSTKGLGRLRVPVVIVPSHLEPQKLDEVAEHT